MRSTFLGFNTARSGLFAAQRALDTTGHNISNVNTPGYSRQRLNQLQSFPMKLYGGQGMLGTGVDSLSITQARNEFLDFKYRAEATTLGHWETKSTGLEFISAIFNEPSETGIATVMNQFFSSFEELAKEPEELTKRALVRQRGIAFSNSLNHMYSQMEKMVKDLNFDIQATVANINGYARQIGHLNEQIYKAESDGSHANDLRDQRNLLIDELSKLVNIDVLNITDINDGMSQKLVIQINGQPLVYHDRAYLLDASTMVESSFDNEVEISQLRWASGDSINVKALGGQLGALIDLRDGEEGNRKGVPFYIKELNRFAGKFADEVNALHRDGYGFKDINDVNYHDIDFFTAFGGASGSGTAITAKNIKISLEIDRDLNAISVSASTDLLPGDGSVATAITKLRHKPGMFDTGKPEDFVKSLISNLGVDMQEANRMTTNQLFLVEQIDRQRQAVSGVSLDEEMSNMVKFQHAYNASARMVTTMDEMLDTIIHKLGIVGR